MNYFERPTILIVDDTPTNLNLLYQSLKGLYRIKLANNGLKALELATTAPPDLILLDIVMPGMNGLEVCSQLKANSITANIPIIFVTTPSNAEDERRGLEIGAVDYIHKPITFPIVQARVKTHLQIKAWQEFLCDQNSWLQQEVNRKVEQVLQLQTATIQVMVSLAEFRDEETVNHIRRTQEYVRRLGIWLVQHNRYENELNATTVEQIAQASSLHDIGKIAIPDNILLKPNRLTPDETAIMKTHTTRGYAILEQVRRDLGQDNPLLIFSSQITRHHHEKWDGNGYPDGLKGEEIPLAARLMAIADVYDASRSVRVYKQALNHEQAMSIIIKGSGNHFDPECVEGFIALEREILEIAIQLADPISN
jgi:putative two-component system response regulator